MRYRKSNMIPFQGIVGRGGLFLMCNYAIFNHFLFMRSFYPALVLLAPLCDGEICRGFLSLTQVVIR